MDMMCDICALYSFVVCNSCDYVGSDRFPDFGGLLHIVGESP